MQLFACVLILMICCIFFGLWYGFQTLASYILPPPFATILTVFVFYHLLVEMCRKFTFPGSTWLWKRNIENHYQRTMAVKIRKKILMLKMLIQYLNESNNIWKELIPQSERRDIAKAVSQVLNLYGKQVTHKTLNERQKVMMDLFTQLDQALRNTNLMGKTCGKGINFWEFLTDDKNQAEIMEPNMTFVFEDKNKSTYLLGQCKTVETKLHSIVCETSLFAGIKRWLFENPFGTLDHVREELDNKYKCQPISIKVSGNNVIDCVLISGKTKDLKDVAANSAPASKDLESIELNLMHQTSKRTQASSIRNKVSAPTMILCCPNAGYYEYTCYESQWVDMYLRLGFNVFLWNYRGYGRSTGKPDPAALRSDGEAIVDYLREDMGIEIIGCHGESIGGLVATHLARWKDLDFLCADRTFESLFTVGRYVFGRGLCLLYKILTGWDDRLVLDFLETKCYKVITFDPKDEVIPFLCSLQHGITDRIVQTRLGVINGEPSRPNEKGTYQIYSPSRWILRLKKLVYSVRSELFIGKIDKKMKGDYGSLSKEQMKAMYRALTRIYDLQETFSLLKHDSIIKKHRRMVSTGGLPVLTTPVKATSQVDEQLNASPVSLQPTNEVNPSLSDFHLMPMIKKDHPDIKRVKSELTLAGRLSNMSHTSHISQVTPDITSHVDYVASLNKEQYNKLFDNDAQKDTDLIIFLENVFTSMELFELGGVQIETIMGVPELQRFAAFKHFLDSLDTWGSYQPLHQTLKEEAINVSYHHNKAIRKLRVLTKRLDHVAKLERTKDQGNPAASAPTLLKNLILEDVELITSVLPTIIKNARIGDEKDFKRCVNTSEGIELMPKNGKEGLAQPLLEAQIDMEKRPKKDYSSTVGHLIPLCCGHNGNLRPLEIEMYEQYVRNAGLV